MAVTAKSTSCPANDPHDRIAVRTPLDAEQSRFLYHRRAAGLCSAAGENLRAVCTARPVMIATQGHVYSVGRKGDLLGAGAFEVSGALVCFSTLLIGRLIDNVNRQRVGGIRRAFPASVSRVLTRTLMLRLAFSHSATRPSSLQRIRQLAGHAFPWHTRSNVAFVTAHEHDPVRSIYHSADSLR